MKINTNFIVISVKDMYWIRQSIAIDATDVPRTSIITASGSTTVWATITTSFSSF
jgi:hypothetical protein